MSHDARHRELLALILDVSFRRESVTLSSGKQSDFYLDLRQTLMRPRGVALAGELVLERLREGPHSNSRPCNTYWTACCSAICLRRNEI